MKAICNITCFVLKVKTLQQHYGMGFIRYGDKFIATKRFYYGMAFIRYGENLLQPRDYQNMTEHMVLYLFFIMRRKLYISHLF